MKINTLSQNNPAFGVRIPIKEVTISKLRDQIPKNKNHQLAKPVDGSILGIIYDKIMNTKQENSSLISFFHQITRRSSEFISLLYQSRKTLERAFWETCDKFFDVQLVANDEDKNINKISNAKIKEDSYLTRIFHPIKNIEENRKQIIEYCIKNYSKAKKYKCKLCEEVKKELNPDMEVQSIRNNILSPILRLPEYYNDFKNATQKEEQTFTKFKEYLKEKAPSDNIKLYNSGNGELLAYTIETFKKYPDFKEKLVFTEDTIANTNTIGKKTSKRVSTKQSYKDAVSFIDYYIGENIINLNLTLKEIHSILFKTNKNHVSLGTLSNWKTTINQIKETLEKYPNKKDEEITNDIRNKCYSNHNCILMNDELFLQVLTKLRTLNKTTNDSDSDSDKINSDTLETKINTRASIKRTYVTEPLDTDKKRTCFNNLLNILNKRQNSTTVTVNTINEKRPHLTEQSSSNDNFKNSFDILYSQLFV